MPVIALSACRHFNSATSYGGQIVHPVICNLGNLDEMSKLEPISGKSPVMTIVSAEGKLLYQMNLANSEKASLDMYLMAKILWVRLTIDVAANQRRLSRKLHGENTADHT